VAHVDHPLGVARLERSLDALPAFGYLTTLIA
jgi:hypothetical protein